MGLWSNPTSSGSGDAAASDGDKARKWANQIAKEAPTRAESETADANGRKKGFWPLACGPRISESDGIKPRRKRGLI